MRPSFRGRRLPREQVQALESAYRSALAGAIPEAGDDSLFHLALCQACAHWALSKWSSYWQGYLSERLSEGETRDTRPGKSPARSAFYRRMHYTYLRLALETLEEFDRLPVLRNALAAIDRRFLAIWPETELVSGYPAFGGDPWSEPE